MSKKPGSFFTDSQPPSPTPDFLPKPDLLKKETKRGTHLISGLFAPHIKRQFGMLAEELQLEKREALAEAINLFFEKYGKPPIAK